MKMQKTSLWLGALIIGFCSSCSNDDIAQTESHKEIAQEVESVEMKKEQMMKQFAEAHDELGSIHIYFYDPLIERKLPTGEYEMRTYNTGSVAFGLAAF